MCKYCCVAGMNFHHNSLLLKALSTYTSIKTSRSICFRALSEKEIAERIPQVITCNDAMREITLVSSTGGKQATKTFRYDKVKNS
jgi:hypothetical protein